MNSQIILLEGKLAHVNTTEVIYKSLFCIMLQKTLKTKTDENFWKIKWMYPTKKSLVEDDLPQKIVAFANVTSKFLQRKQLEIMSEIIDFNKNVENTKTENLNGKTEKEKFIALFKNI